MIRSLIWIVLFLSKYALADEVVVVVDLRFIKDTGEAFSTLCFEEGTKYVGCSTWATFYLFEARVKKVIRGESVSRKFHVWFGTHALEKGNIRNAVAKLRPLPPEHEASYQIVALGERKELYCFPVDESTQASEGVRPQGSGMQCDDPEEL